MLGKLNFYNNIIIINIIVIFSLFFLSNHLILEDEFIINGLFFITFIFLSQLVKQIVAETLKNKKTIFINQIQLLINKLYLLNFYYSKFFNFIFIIINSIYINFFFNKLFKFLLKNNLNFKFENLILNYFRLYLLNVIFLINNKL